MKSLVRAVRDIYKMAISDEISVMPDGKFMNKRFGSEYGGWNVVAASINSGSVVYSFGIGEDASFDTELIAEFGLTVHAFDPTPKSIQWVKNQGFSSKFVMHEYGLAAFDGIAFFNPPENEEHVSHTLLDRPATKTKAISVPVKKLSTIMEELGHEHIEILKVDIEGAEYDVINDMDRSGIIPNQVLVEFHHEFPGVGAKMTKDAINKLRSIGYLLFSLSSTKKECCFIHKQCS